MTKFTAADIRANLANLASIARRAGILEDGAALIYSAGSKVNGNAPGVWIRRADGTHAGRARMLPRFTHLATPREVMTAIDAAAAALYEVLDTRR